MKKTLSLLLLLIVASTAFAQDTKLPQLSITTENSTKISTSYVKGVFELTDTEGNVVSLNAKFKIRGATASHYTKKPALNVKLRDEDGESLDTCLLGIRSCSKWILDAMAIDRICMRNRVAMDIWNDYASLPYKTDFPLTSSDGKIIYRSGTIGKFIEVTINNQYKGIYVLSDHINQKLLNLKKVAKKQTTENDTIRGVLYKSGTSDISDQGSECFTDDYTACVISYHNAWELKEPEDYECYEAWEPLLDSQGSKLASGTGEKISSYAQVKKYFDLSNLVDYQLHIMALNIADNWGNKNHFFSIRNIQKDINDADATEAARRKFIVSPWDLDTCLGGNYNGSYYDGNYNVSWLPADAVKNGGFFPFSLCQGNNEYQQMMKKRWEEVRKTSYLPANVNKRLENYRDLFINSGAWERNGTIQPKYVEDLTKEINYIEDWYSDRYKIMDSYFGITDGIENVNIDDYKDSDSNRFYTLDGHSVVNPTSPGIYINSKHKKVVIK